jgi:hypothetical protein
MNTSNRYLQLGLDDLLGDLRYARRRGDLGRLALISYCEVRRWARMAGYQQLAEHSSELVTNLPPESREAFLARIDNLIVELEKARVAFSSGTVAEGAIAVG